MEVNAGFKQTEAGNIPQDWEARPLSEIAKVTSGKRLPVGHFVTEKETPYPYIRVTDMRPGRVDTRDIKYVPVVAFEPISKYRIFKDDLFISVAGTLGIVGKIPEELDGANLTENADRISAITCDRDYLLHVMLSPIVQSVIESERTVGAQPKLALMRIRNFSIPLPPTLDEQRAIAAALSDVDALLDGLDRLFVKKLELKQAAMQQLLTCQTRLPGFGAEWTETRLGALGTFEKGSGVKKSESNSGGLPCVRYGEIYTHHENVIREFFSSISTKVASTATRLQQSDLLFAASGETKKEIGKCAAFTSNAEAYAGGDIVILRGHGQQPTFMGYYCNAPDVANQKASRGQGDAVVHISARALGDIVVRLPPIDEQEAIAAVLSDMDAELAALKARRDKTQNLKQAMMQELLNGKTRLIPTEGSHV